MGKKDERAEKIENFWAFQRQRIASELNELRYGERLSLAERLEVTRLMAADTARTTRNIMRLATATRELAEHLDAALVLAQEIVKLNVENKLAPLQAPPIEEDPGEWLKNVATAQRGSANAATQLATLAPDIIQAIGAIDPENGPKSKR